jgi:hypothetical protein
VDLLGKIRVNLTIDEEVKKKAEELGLNLSRVAENALKEAVRRLEAKDSRESFIGDADFSVNAFPKRVVWCGGRDLDPCSPKARDLESCAIGPTGV